jgi:hypothetical protein
MKLLNIVSPGNDSAIDDCTKLPTVDQPFKTAKKGHKLKKGKYGMNSVGNYSGTSVSTSAGEGSAGGSGGGE